MPRHAEKKMEKHGSFRSFTGVSGRVGKHGLYDFD
jgi:hypothetical protein